MNAVLSPRQLVICCDGTNNNLTGGVSDTNVVKLAQLVANAQVGTGDLLFYDPGVGNPGELPGATVLDTWGRMAERLGGLAFGRGVYENMAESYAFLMQHYRTGDEIYIFGFSRGAFTARSLAGMVNMFGVLQPHMASMLPTLLHVYFSDRETQKDKMDDIAGQISNLFAGGSARKVEIKFVGVWDTVDSVGMWPFNAKITAVPTVEKKMFLHVRQAIALDEHRAQFKPRLFINDNGSSGSNGAYLTATGKPVTVEQLWFRGSHCDVGGGYEAGFTAISDQAFAWLVSEAVSCGLALRAGATLLDTEAAVLAALAAASGAQVGPPTTMPVVSSTLRKTSLWALTGLAVRDTQKVVLDDDRVFFVKPVEHASVAATLPQFPADTVWATPRPKTALVACTVTMLVVMLALGQLLSGRAFSGNVLADIGHYLHQNANFARWQLGWWLDLNPFKGLAQFAAPLWAVVWDFVLIGFYGYVLSWFVVLSFARKAGLRRVGSPVSAWLNRLGWALPLAVLGDVLENLATLAVIACRTADWLVVGWLMAIPMTLFALAKWVGLAGVLALVCLPSKQTQGP